VPGLDYCCGICHLEKGRPGRAGNAFSELMDKITSYQPKTVVLWCPTCFCLAETTFGPFTEYPFKIQSMAQYVSEHLDKLEIVEKLSTNITVHDACKVALTGLDVVGSRKILKAIGAEIVEMPRSGPESACCGCDAIGNYPEAGNQMLEDRLWKIGLKRPRKPARASWPLFVISATRCWHRDSKIFVLQLRATSTCWLPVWESREKTSSANI